MGSYVISVSAGTGCYRHIQISKSATLYNLHKAIISAFAFDDDHAHAFFMDNHYWSANAFFSMKIHGDERLTKNYKLEKLKLTKGDQFKYIFDFGDEWRFQCKVLRTVEETVDIPSVIRRVGESPEQYPQWEDDASTDSSADSVPDILMEDLSDEQLKALYDCLPLSEAEIALIRKYFEAAANLYGLISLKELLGIYNKHNPPIDAAALLVLSSLLDCEDNNPYTIITRNDMPSETTDEALVASEIVADYLFVEEPEEDIRNLRRSQKGKPYKLLPKDEFLRYSDPCYYPPTLARTAMLKYLRRREKSLSLPPEDFCDCIQSVISVDAPMQEVLNIVQNEGLVFNKHWDIGEFAALYQNLNNSTHKHVNCGHTPDELFAMSNRGKQLAERIAPANQMSLFDEPVQKPILTLVGTPPRNALCPCGSGRKYKNCCGKGNKP